jgi:hypothetical protein
MQLQDRQVINVSNEIVTSTICVQTGISGGLLFENFAVTSGKRTSRRAIVALAKLCAQEKRKCTDLESDHILAVERVGFFSYILMCLANRGRSANRQLFFYESACASARAVSHRHGFSKQDECVPGTPHI